MLIIAKTSDRDKENASGVKDIQKKSDDNFRHKFLGRGRIF
jgi:hypothetical protein